MLTVANNTGEDEVAWSKDDGNKVSVSEVDAFLATTTAKIAAKKATTDQETVQDETLEPASHVEEKAKGVDDVTVTDGVENEVEAESSRPKRSVPPHLRPDLQVPTVRQPTPSGSKVEKRCSKPVSVANMS